MIHIKTQKGKGYSYAEKATDHYHGVSKFDVVTGEQVKVELIFQPIQKFLQTRWLNMRKEIAKL